jgi:acetyl-CoA C-acetyltransferase
MGGFVIRQLVERNAIPAEDYDDVVFGAIDTVASLAGNIARTCWLAAGLPLTVPGVTIDRQFRASPSTGNAAPRSRRSISLHKRS